MKNHLEFALRTFDDYWRTRTNPSANTAWEECAEERDIIIQELKNDLEWALKFSEHSSLPTVKMKVYDIKKKWKLF